MSYTLNVVTLNCWAIPFPYPFGSTARTRRIQAIAQTLLDSNYDVVSLQELWSEKDFHYITTFLKEIFPFAHYFHSGFTGSGTCVISKFRIVSTLKHNYSLNGFAHHIHRGDWFGGKLIGMVEIMVGRMKVAIYTTHLHAEYNRHNDPYLPHRLIQAYEVGQFVRYTSQGADLAIVTGDFNIEPQDLAYKVVTDVADLKDAWVVKPNVMEISGMTCDRPDNCFTNLKLKQDNPLGKRLDYIFFKEGSSAVKLIFCDNTFDVIPGSKMNYSDHLGVYARFTLQQSADRTFNFNTILSVDENMMEEALAILDQGQLRAQYDKKLFAVISSLLGIALITSFFFNFWEFKILVNLVRLVLTLVLGFSVWHWLIILTIEIKGLKESRSSFKEVLKKSPSSINDSIHSTQSTRSSERMVSD
uniref:Endo/exonuclease/phosphatase domain-containing protein n=2 Tax=Rhabditophanes sp. KR3021 TaxID=114890 RepID=A0AC35UE80_9BILA